MRAALVAALLLVGLAIPASAACPSGQCVQHAEQFTAGSQNPTLVFTNNIAAGNCVAFYVLVSDATNSVTSATADFVGGNATLKNANTLFPTTNAQGTLAYFFNATGGGKTVTVHVNGTSNVTIFGHEISGCLTTDPFDVSTITNQTNIGTGTDAITTAGITTTVNGDYLFCQSLDEAVHNIATGTGFVTAAVGGQAANEFQTQSVAGAGTVCTFTGDTAAQNYQTGILALKPATVAPTRGCVIGGGLFFPGCPG